MVTTGRVWVGIALDGGVGVGGAVWHVVVAASGAHLLHEKREDEGESGELHCG